MNRILSATEFNTFKYNLTVSTGKIWETNSDLPNNGHNSVVHRVSSILFKSM